MSSSMIPRQRNRRRSTAAHPALENLESRVVLSTFRVNTVVDSVAVSLKTGKDASGHISLRSAIQAASREAQRRQDYSSRWHVRDYDLRG